MLSRNDDAIVTVASEKGVLRDAFLTVRTAMPWTGATAMLTDEPPLDLLGTPDQQWLHDLISKHFSPAMDAGDASLMLTTEEFHAKLQEHAPGELMVFTTRSALESLNYKEHNLDGHLVWLIRER